MKRFIFIGGCAFLMCGAMIFSSPHYPPQPRPLMVKVDGTLANSDTNFFLINSNLLRAAVGTGVDPGTTNQWRMDATNAAAAVTNDYPTWHVDSATSASSASSANFASSALTAGTASYANSAAWANGLVDGAQILEADGSKLTNIGPASISGCLTTNFVVPGVGTLNFNNGVLQSITP